MNSVFDTLPTNELRELVLAAQQAIQELHSYSTPEKMAEYHHNLEFLTAKLAERERNHD